MDISAGLIAKAVGGTAAVAAASGTSYAFREEIGYFLFGPHLSEEIKQANEKLVSLGIPDDCRFGKEWSFSDCNSFDSDKLNAIKFEGKTTGSITIPDGANLSLKVEKTAETSFFAEGLKFIFSNEKDIAVPDGSSQITLKANTNTEFKIKTSGETSTLEKAWNAKTLGEKVGLTCPENGNSVECSITTSLSVFEEDSKKATGLSNNSSAGPGKIKFEGDQKGYNQGFKFFIDGGEINLNGTGSDDVKKLKEFAAYEIKEHNEGSEKKWYLTKKSSASKEIAKILKLPEGCGLPTGNNNLKECTINSKKNLKKINFEGKVSSSDSGNDSINVNLKIQKETGDNYPLGYKFIFKASGDAINIPETGNNQITINTTDTEFKIKKSGSNLTLEKNS